MDRDYQVHNLFSKVFYQTSLEYNKEQLDLWINHLQKEFTLSSYGYYVNDQKDNTELFSESSLRKDILEDKIFLNLKKNIMKEFNYFKNKYLQYVNNDFVITRSWISKVKKGQTSFYHNHNNCMFSGIYYLKTDNKSGFINFENFNDKRFFLKPNSYNKHNANDFTFSTHDNLLLFFPSECHHRILRHDSDFTRYSIAFNLMPTGELGGSKSDSYCNIHV